MKANNYSRRPNLPKTAVAAAISAALSLPAVVVAQSGDIDEIVVTGSRIPADPNVISSVPIQSLNAEDIRNSGEINIADIVADIPALISSQTAENSTTGANSLNLRGLGGDRTLTLVNGRRHVAGFRGSQAVDTGTIPRALVRSVEVTTGGASAVYGADAVTGVVNFILRDDFEGFQVDIQQGLPERGDGRTTAVDATWGMNFDDDRGNVAVSLSFEDDTGILYGDRDWSKNNGISSVGPRANPSTDPNAPPRAVVDNPTFWLTSQAGSIAPTFGGRSTTYVDINNNGIADCQESEGGRVGYLAGCWITNPDGSVRVNQDGTVLGTLWGQGGDGGVISANRDSLYPETERAVVNINANYDLTDTFNVFFEGKYVEATSTTFSEGDGFYDTLFIQADNPYIPSQLLPVVAQTGGLLLTQDPHDFSDNNPSEYIRETTRFVAGFEWEMSPEHTLEVSVNHGEFTNTSNVTTTVLDRTFAAIDAVKDSSGNIVCRSDLNPSAAYEIDYFAGSNSYANGAYASDRYYSFTPGDGQCQPLNPFGTYSASEAAQNFITMPLQRVLELDQTVLNATLVGEFEFASRLLDGPIGYATGVEYREESSLNILDPLDLGIMPAGTSYTAGQSVNEVSDWLYTFIDYDNSQQYNTQGEYDVTDAFVEFRLPVLRGRALAEELTIDGAARVANYSTLGEATTWKFGATWAPNSELSFRGTISEAVRAPNISELFDPKLPITVAANADPCDPNNVANGTANREANCIAALQATGLAQADIFDSNGNYAWTNPLTARFAGVSGGNPALDVETANTVTVGAVYRPEVVEGLTLTVDYWDVVIQDAISAVGSSDILEGCFDSASYPSLGFCNAFTRRGDGGLNFLETGQINFAKLEARGIDFSANYDFAVGENNFGVRLVGSRQERLDRFFNPLDMTDVDPEIMEIQRPRLTASLGLSWDRGPVRVGLQTIYQGKQGVDEIEEVRGIAGQSPLYGSAGFFGNVLISDLNASYQWKDGVNFFAGINNLWDEEPFSTQTAWPVGPRGRTLFLGLSYSL